MRPLSAQGFEIKNSLGNVLRLSYFRLIYGSLVLKTSTILESHLRLSWPLR